MPHMVPWGSTLRAETFYYIEEAKCCQVLKPLVVKKSTVETKCCPVLKTLAVKKSRNKVLSSVKTIGSKEE